MRIGITCSLLFLQSYFGDIFRDDIFLVSFFQQCSSLFFLIFLSNAKFEFLFVRYDAIPLMMDSLVGSLFHRERKIDKDDRKIDVHVPLPFHTFLPAGGSTS